MIDHLQIQAHAIKAANDGQDEKSCPFAESSVQGQLWLDYFYTQVMWLSGETSA